MRTKFTLSRPTTIINSIPSWVDLGTGANVWSIGGLNASVTLGSFQGSSRLADDILNAYNGVYRFLITASGTVNGGAGNTAQLTFHFLNSSQEIVETSDPITIPNAGIVAYEFEFDSDGVVPTYIALQANNLTGSSNTVTATVSYQALPSSIEIAEPGGWQEHEITLERHPEFDCLIESVFSDSKFIFYGDDLLDGSGGINYIKTIEAGGAVDEKIQVEIELAPDDVTYEPYFTGLLQLEGLSELPGNELEIPIIRDDFWSTFLKRWDTPVDLRSNQTINGNPCTPLEPVTLRLPSQKIEQKYLAHFDAPASYAQFTDNVYYQVDFNDVIILDEIKELHTIPIIDNPELPGPNFTVEYAGDYVFDIRIIASTFTLFDAESVKDPTDLIDFYIQFGNQNPIAFSWEDETIGDSVHTLFTYSGTVELTKNTPIRIFGRANSTTTKDLVISGGDSTGFSGSSPYASYCSIVAETIFPETEVEGFFIHDIANGILEHLDLGENKFYSDAFGSTVTRTRQYGADGCYSNFICVKGMHLRGYGLAGSNSDASDRYANQEKPFFISMKEWYEGVHPIFNITMYPEFLDDSPESQVIRAEIREDVYDAGSTSVDFDFVYDIVRTYDKDRIFKKITVGYNKWESEDISGIDDPQTKHVYATRFSSVGADINILSGFIAASLLIEQARRVTIEKSKDYRYDNDTFIIAVDPEPTTPEEFYPELDENFVSVTNLLHSETRYNLILTPSRNLFRWANFLIGCLQSYLNSEIKFVSGEGNFDMLSEHSCPDGEACLAIICDEVGESQNISLEDYASTFGYLHLPMLYEVEIPMEWEQYRAIRENPKKAIGISQSDSDHKKFYIKQLNYSPLKGRATIQAWAKEYFDIQVPDNMPQTSC